MHFLLMRFAFVSRVFCLSSTPFFPNICLYSVPLSGWWVNNTEEPEKPEGEDLGEDNWTPQV